MYYKTNTLFFIYEGTYLLPESYLTMKIWVVAASDKLSLKVVSSFNTHLIKWDGVIIKVPLSDVSLEMAG